MKSKKKEKKFDFVPYHTWKLLESLPIEGKSPKPKEPEKKVRIEKMKSPTELKQKIKILVACEESQAVCKAFRKLGREAYSCDILPCSGGHPDWHLQQDVLPLLKQKWDMIIAFPPCTDLAVSGAAWFDRKRKDGSQQKSIEFFLKFANAKCKRIAIESPVGIMSSVWRKPDQIIQPYMFGEPFSKKTCLWLKGLPLLKPTKLVDKGERVTFKSGKSMPKWYSDAFRLPPKERSIVRSRTFQGIADAMADQWSKLF